MGCWNQTCGLTQIHIKHGEKVIVVPLASAAQDNLCYTTPFWAPFLVPFYSEYNDYGGGECSSGMGLELVIDYLKEKAVEIEQGPNEYHDCAVVRETFDEDKFWDAIHEQRLRVQGWRKETSQVGFTMIKQSVFDHLAENFKLDSYDYETRKEDHYNFNQLLADVPALVDVMVNGPRDETLLEGLNEEDRERYEDILFFYEPVERAARSIKSTNRAARWLAYSSSHLRYGGWTGNIVDTKAIQFMKGKDAESLTTLLTDHLKMQFIDVVLMSTRKFWSPQAGAGSQNDGIEAYRELMAAMTHVLDEEEAERKSWDDEWEAEEVEEEE